MKKGTIIFIILFSIVILIIIGLILCIHFGLFKQFYNRDQNDIVTLTFSIRDRYSNEFVKSNIYIYKTEKDEKQFVKKVKSVEGLEQVNLENNNNYTFIVISKSYYNERIIKTIQNNQKLNIFLNKKGDINVSISNSSLTLGWNDIIVNVTSKRYLNDLIICIRYGYGTDIVMIDKIFLENQSIPNQTYCYNIINNLNYNETTSFKLTYKLEEKTNFSFIKLVFFNKNLDEFGNDIFVERKTYIIPKELQDEKYNL